jgi:hypothetical protein
LEEQSLKRPVTRNRGRERKRWRDLTVEAGSCSTGLAGDHGIISLSFVQLFRLTQACAESDRRVTLEWKIVEFDVGPAVIFGQAGDLPFSKELRMA